METKDKYLNLKGVAKLLSEILDRPYSYHAVKRHVNRFGDTGLRPANDMNDLVHNLLFTRQEVEAYVERYPERFTPGPASDALTVSKLFYRRAEFLVDGVTVTNGDRVVVSIEQGPPRSYVLTYEDGTTETCWNSKRLEAVTDV